MKLPNWFKILWWLLLLVIVTYFGCQRYDSFIKGSATLMDVFVFLVWISLLLVPLFKEVSFFGMKFKQEIDSLKNEVREQIMNLRSEIQTSVNLQNRITVIQSHASGVIEQPAAKEDKPSLDALKVLSTLWNHQKEYYGEELTINRWTFAVGFGSINYPEYAKGLGDALRRGLASIAGNGQAMLTDEGIKYCKTNKNELLPDWNFDRWKTI